MNIPFRHDLPGNYGKDRIVVMVRDPHRLHCYWELTRHALQRAEAALGQEWHTARPILRLLDVSGRDTTGASESILRDIDVLDGSDNWYIDVAHPPRSYRVEVGYLARSGRFHTLARSNVATTPPTGLSDVLDESWRHVDPRMANRIYALSGGFDPTASSLELKQLFEQRLLGPSGSSAATSFASGRRGTEGESGPKRRRDADAEIDRFLRRLARLGRELESAGDPEGTSLARRVRRIRRTLGRKKVLVVFAGLHNAGKSTTLNALIGRPLLPVNDLPETGTFCELHRGPADRAVLHGPDGPREVPCEAEAIRREIALIDAGGCWRPEVGALRKLDVALADGPVPPAGLWVDTPGIHTVRQAETDRRVRRLVRRADLLVWVLRGPPVPGMEERAFFRPRIADLGAAGTLVLTNVFLRAGAGPQDWTLYVNRDWPRQVKRWQDGAAAEAGFPPGQMPELLPLAAEAAGLSGGGFGLEDLRARLTGLDGPHHPRVRQVRLGRTVRGLDRLERALARLEEREAAAAREAQRERAGAKQKRRAFAEGVASAVSTVLGEVRGAAQEAAAGLVAEVPGRIQGPNPFRDLLHRELVSCARSAGERLLRAVEKLARRHDQRAVSAKGKSRIRGLLVPDWIPDFPAFPGCLRRREDNDTRSALQRWLEETLGGRASNEELAARDCAVLTRQRIERVTRDLVAEWEREREKLAQEIVNVFPAPHLPRYDPERLRTCRRQRAFAGWLAAEARRLGGTSP